MDIIEHIQDLLGQGITLMKAQNYEDAKKTFETVLEENPECFEAYIHLGNACVNLGLMDDAIKSFSSALILDNHSGAALFSIANVYYLKNDIQNAIKYYVRAENVGFHSVDMYLIMGDIFHSSGDTVQALRYVSKAVKEQPLRGELWRQKVLLELELGQVDIALDTLDEFEAILPDALDIHELRSRILIERGQFQEAKEHLDQAAVRFPDDMRILLLRVRLEIMSENYDAALAEIEKIRAEGKDKGYKKPLALELAEIYLRKEDTAQIIESIQWGLEENQNDPDLLFILLNTYIASLDYPHIIEFADKLRSDNNVDTTVYTTAVFYRALSLRETGHTEEANKCFQKIVKEFRKLSIDNPENLELFIFRLLAHNALKEYDKAFELADFLGAVSPNKSDAHAFRSLIYKEMGDKEKAEAELVQARKANPAFKG